MNEVFRISEIAEGCTKLFKKPIEMEFEKLYHLFYFQRRDMRV